LYNTLTKLEDHDNSKLNISPDRPIPFNYSLDDPSRDSVNLCPEAVDDRFAFGNAKVMKKYSSVYSNYKSIIKRRLPASAECLLGINVKDNKLEVCQNNWQIAFYKGGDWSQSKDGRYSIRGGFKNN